MTTYDSNDIRANAQNWNLAGDAKLLELMESISEGLERRCLETNKNINKMLLNVEETNIKLGNITNKLLALQHSQFVENRICEDENDNTNEEKISEKEKEETDSISPKAAIQLAVDNGIKMLNFCYEKMSLNIEDSDNDDDDENNINNIAFRPKDPFLNQSIPFIIGSKEWKDNWHMGLVESDIDSDEDDEADINEFSETSSNASLSISLPSNAPTISESEGSIWGLSTVPPINKNIFDDENDDEEEDRLYNSFAKSTQINASNTIQEESRPKMVLPPQIPQLPTKSIFQKQPEQRKTINLFDDEPPELDDDVVKPVQQTQKKPVNLFDIDDNDSYDDLFASTVKPAKTIYSPKDINLFDDDPPLFDENENKSDKNEEKLPSTIATNKVDNVVPTSMPNITKKTKITNLFDDDPMEDDLDIFIQFKKDNTNNNKAQIKPPTTSKLFNDGEDDSFDNIFNVPVRNEINDIPKQTETPSPIPSSNITSLILEKDSFNEIPTLSTNNDEPQIDEDDWITKSDKNIFDKFNDKNIVQEKVNREKSFKFDTATLFDDVPPADNSDDFIIKSKSSAKLPNTNVYYDDTESFSSIINNNNLGSSNSQYVLNDETPSFEEYNNKIDSFKKVDRDVTDDALNNNSNNFKEKMNLFSNYNEIKSTNNDESDPKADIPKPKKLNTNLKINVAALLPGMKPTLARHRSEKSSSSSLSQDDNEVDKTEIDKNIYITPEFKQSQIISSNDTKILTSLNKTRAKIQTKRRPSTRKGRQEVYRKSMIADNNEEKFEKDPLDQPFNILAGILNPSDTDNRNLLVKKPKPSSLFSDYSDDDFIDNFIENPKRKNSNNDNIIKVLEKDLNISTDKSETLLSKPETRSANIDFNKNIKTINLFDDYEKNFVNDTDHKLSKSDDIKIFSGNPADSIGLNKEEHDSRKPSTNIAIPTASLLFDEIPPIDDDILVTKDNKSLLDDYESFDAKLTSSNDDLFNEPLPSANIKIFDSKLSSLFDDEPPSDNEIFDISKTTPNVLLKGESIENKTEANIDVNRSKSQVPLNEDSIETKVIAPPKKAETVSKDKVIIQPSVASLLGKVDDPKKSNIPNFRQPSFLDPIDDDYDDLFKKIDKNYESLITEKKSQSYLPINTENIQSTATEPPQTISTLFEEHNKASFKKEDRKPTKLFDDNDDDLFKNSKSQKSMQNENLTKSSLFDDDEDDDLFGTDKLLKSIPQTKFQPVKTLPVQHQQLLTQPKSSNLFDSDDDDSDLFSGGASSTKTAKKSGLTFLKSSSKNKTNLSLFGDDNDDDDADDLFKIKKVPNVTATKRLAFPTKTKSLKPTTETISDDPLADLLK